MKVCSREESRGFEHTIFCKLSFTCILRTLRRLFWHIWYMILCFSKSLFYMCNCSNLLLLFCSFFVCVFPLTNNLDKPSFLGRKNLSTLMQQLYVFKIFYKYEARYRTFNLSQLYTWLQYRVCHVPDFCFVGIWNLDNKHDVLKFNYLSKTLTLD